MRASVSRAFLARSDDRLGALVPGSIALGLAVGLQALGGLAFWLLAARQHATDSIGEASALFQSLLFLNYVAGLGLPVALARFGGLGPTSSVLMAWATRLRIAAAVVSAGLFLILTVTTDIADPLWGDGIPAGVVMYVVLAVGMALAVLVEVRLVTLRRWGWLLVRAGVPAVARLPLLLLVAHRVDDLSGAALFLLAAGPMALSGFVGVVVLRLTDDRVAKVDERLDPSTRAAFLRCAGVNWLGTVATEGPIFAVPLIVALAVDSAENAAFYVAWSFGALVFVLPQMVAQVTLSEASREGPVDPKLLGGLRLALGVTMVAAVVAQLGSGRLASAYGSGYDLVADDLPLLVAASICWCYTAIGLVSARLAGRDHDVAMISLIFLTATVVPTVLLVGANGASAATWSWLCGNALAAVASLLVHLRRRGAPTPDRLPIGLTGQ